jgi:putative endonuclease
MDALQFGQRGEETAEAFLQKLGYQVLHRNFRTREGEIDLVARDPLGSLIAVEVKSRKSIGFGYPECAVHMTKQQRLVRTAAHLLEVHYPQESIRFDVIAIIKNGNTTCIMHFLDAFRP